MTSTRPSLLFYCQHSLGMGHLVRSLALAAELAERFRVVFLNGGRFPRGLTAPDGVEVVALPPLGMDASGRLVSRDGRRSVERAQATRGRMILDAFARTRPEVVLVELFPFGRKKFAGELLPLLDAARSASPRAAVVCSLRDILVSRADQSSYDARAVELANRSFDAILVHSDPRFARLEESLGAGAALRVPVHHTGFVVPARPTSTPVTRRRRVVVSAGGGIAGEDLLRSAVEARRLLGPSGLPTTVVAGPFLPESAWCDLRVRAEATPGVTLRRFVRDLAGEMAASTASISQCGYNTAFDVLRSRTPALVVPYGADGEDEQTRRAERLERLGLVRVLAARDATPVRLAEVLRALADFAPARVDLDLDGARTSARIAADLVAAPRAAGRAAR